MESKQPDVMAILKLYALRRDEKMRAARAWFFTEFNPASASDIVKLMFSGEANTEHLAVFAKLEPFMVEVREVFGEANYLAHLETLVMKIPHATQIMVGRRKLFASWAKNPASEN